MKKSLQKHQNFRNIYINVGHVSGEIKTLKLIRNYYVYTGAKSTEDYHHDVPPDTDGMGSVFSLDSSLTAGGYTAT